MAFGLVSSLPSYDIDCSPMGIDDFQKTILRKTRHCERLRSPPHLRFQKCHDILKLHVGVDFDDKGLSEIVYEREFHCGCSGGGCDSLDVSSES